MATQQIIHLSLAVIIWLIGFSIYGKIIRPKWKVPGKAVFYLAVSYILSIYFGNYSLIFIIGHPLLGLAGHIWICKKHHINWITCEPRDKFMKLQTDFFRQDIQDGQD